MSVRAKFKVESVTNFANGSSVVLNPVCSGTSEENKKFYQYTPGGQIKLEIVNSEAAKQFIPGKEYYVDFTPAVEELPT